jgi:hypothetical protein
MLATCLKHAVSRIVIASVGFGEGKKMIRIALFSAFVVLSAAPSHAAVLSAPATLRADGAPVADLIQYSRGGSRAFRRCMRAKYGPRYFQGVRRAQRFIMAQACGG